MGEDLKKDVDYCAKVTGATIMQELTHEAMRIPIVIGKILLLALIDSRSTQNFIDLNIVQEFELTT